MSGILVALLVATTSLLLPQATNNSIELVALLAMLAAMLTFVEYNSHFPSFVEFRDAPPLNRIRFVALFAMIFLLTVICKHKYEPTSITTLFTAFGVLNGNWADFPYSPVRLVILMLPDDALASTVNAVRISAAVSYIAALATVGTFWICVRVLGWPTSSGAFNVWVNLPLFDPTSGGDVVQRLQRDGRINIILGVLLPFIIPAVVKAASDWVNPISMDNPQTLIWTMSAWSFLPASMIMRGMAMLRISDLIEEKRRRTYANADSMQTA